MTMRVAAAALVALAAAASPASAARESTIQDDHRLLDGTTAQRRSTLDEMGKLGADRVRVTVLWKRLAPAPTSRSRPSFDAADPAAYPAGVFAPLDAVVRDAAARGLGVNFDITGPAPLWATRRPPRQDVAATYEPSAREFGLFVTALGRHYSGDVAGIPRVAYWSVWNEPNQSGWLTPQWRDKVERAPAVYRALAAAAWAALADTGHRRDIVLVGETAPKGLPSPGVKRFLTPLAFVRALYCVDRKLQRLRGAAARARDCPIGGPRAFVRANPALFSASGYAHHPYNLLEAPSSRPRDHDFVTIGSLDRLTRTLDRILRAYDVRRRLPLYLTEFGYQTPPDPFGVSMAVQAAWLNQSEYIATRNPRVRTLGQFLLYDDGPPEGSTFQSGLRSHGGARKPSWAAYRLPVWLPRVRVKRGRLLTVWALLRAAPRSRARIEFRVGSGAWTSLATVRPRTAQGEVLGRVRPPASGQLRVEARAGRETLTSRTVRVRVTRRA
jgi:hypothetical protein